MAKAGRYLRAVLDPDGEERDEQADYGRRFLRVRPGADGGVEGEFYLPREAAARLRALLDAYAKPKAEGDDRPLRVRYADAFIALLEDKIVTELLVLVSAESLPTDPEPASTVPGPANGFATRHPESAQPATEHSERTGHPAGGSPASISPTTQHPEAEHPGNTGHPEGERRESTDRPGAGTAAGNPGGGDRPGTCHPVSDHLPADDHPRDAERATDARDAEDIVDLRDGEDVSAPDSVGSCEEPSAAVYTGDSALSEAGDNTSDSAPDRAVNPGGADRSATSGTCHPATAHAEAIEDSEAAEGIGDCRDGEAVQEGRRAAVPAGDAESPSQHGHAQGQGPRSRESRWGQWRSCDPPGHTCAHLTHAGPRPAGEVPHGQGRADGPSGPRLAGPESAPEAPGTSGAPGVPGPEPARSPRPEPRTPGTPDPRPGAPGPQRDAPSGTGLGTSLGNGLGASSGPEPGAPGTAPGPLFGTAAGAALGASGLVPGLLLATGQVLPVSSVHRLARTSTLVRIVMDAQGQVLDMGRKVRLATPAQRRAIFARYATCWVDGCPLPATLCQIDHADNWSTGGLTDLKLLGPACQFHNRDRYRHPDRYTRRKVGKDRWAFTYHRLTAARRPRE
ncbi:hypothetical protein GCM10010116_10170 [Microbispora rosea subsp. aerata]|nr:hypothetical protein GCM10010116_10170 [Microbispora rosea subsp. aerata]